MILYIIEHNVYEDGILDILPVYKFMSGEDYHLDSLRENTVWFSNVHELNDPYEGRIHFVHSDVNINHKILALAHALNEEKNDIKQSRKEAENFRKKNGDSAFLEMVDRQTEKHFNYLLEVHHKKRHVLSLSKAIQHLEENRFSKPLNNMMMWGHYAKGFRGMCVEYDFYELRRSINQLNDINATTKEVDYIEGNLPIIKSKTLLTDMIEKNDNTSREILKAYCTKHKAWSYENEIRIISAHHGLNKRSEESVNRVFVSSLNQKLLEDVKDILKAKTHKPELCSVSLHDSEYGFFFKRIDY